MSINVLIGFCVVVLVLVSFSMSVCGRYYIWRK